MPANDIILLIAALAFLELGWYYSAALLALMLTLVVYFGYQQRLREAQYRMKAIDELNKFMDAEEAKKKEEGK